MERKRGGNTERKYKVSHFATFFIDARAEISVAESRCE